MRMLFNKGIINFLIMIVIVSGFFSCGGGEEYSDEEIALMKDSLKQKIIGKTVIRRTDQDKEAGTVGGTYSSSITGEPRTFNFIIGEDDPDSRTIVQLMKDYLLDYDPYKREWIPNCAEYRVEIDEEKDILRIYYTLKEELYWTNYSGKDKVKVTSDDVVFWYDEIEGDKNLQLDGYASQFIKMKDGSVERVTINKVDERTFYFEYPRIVAAPELSSNMTFGPMYIYKKAKETGGTDELFKVHSIDSDVKDIPSMGKWHVAEYTPGVRVLLTRNPDYWKKDKNGTSLPYIEESVLQIVSDINTEYLLFKQGKRDAYAARAEDLEELVENQTDYTVYNGGLVLGSAFLSFNQNPNTLDEKYYNWFSKKEFRQAMSCLVNKKRIIRQIYRGLGEPKEHFFAEPNPYFNPKNKNKYTYDPQRAVKLLKSIGIEPNDQGFMVDNAGNPVEFTLEMGTSNNVWVDIGTIISDEAKKVGVTINVKPIDFQKIIDSLTKTYEWQSLIISLGINYFPTQGSNVWPSDGRLHLWHPLQKEPVTEWEARIDELYNEGSFTRDTKKAAKIWNEYEKILLEQLPVIYLVQPYGFTAVRNRWNNVFYDTLNGLKSSYFYLKEK